MSTPEDVNPIEALSALLTSDGWRLFQQEMTRQWGPHAQIAQIDQALRATPAGNTDAVNDSVQQIRSAANAVTNALDWPAAQLARLKQKAEPKSFGFRRRA